MRQIVLGLLEKRFLCLFLEYLIQIQSITIKVVVLLIQTLHNQLIQKLIINQSYKKLTSRLDLEFKINLPKMIKKRQANILNIAEDYFNNIFGQIPGMKALLLDKQTASMISIVYTQSKLYKHDIYLIQKTQQATQRLPHLKALYLVRPTVENIQNIIAQLKQPRFQQYHLFFTNEISNKMIDKLAEHDPSDKIKNIQEVYLDYYAVGRNIFSLNIPSTISLSRRPDQWGQTQKAVISRMAQGLIAMTMSLRVLPQVSYLNGSASCSKIAQIVSQKFEKEMMEKQSDYPHDQRAILIITERKQDPVTPLLTPWTYEAMLHEFIGIFNNKVDIVNKQKAFLGSANQKLSLKEKQQREFVLSQLSDEFFKKNAYNEFGQLASNIKNFINQVSSKRNKTVKLDSLQDMHSALDKIPQLNALAATLQKHVTLSCQISEQIEKGVLFEVSRIEQDLICQENRSSMVDQIWKILKNDKIQYYLKFKLVLLYSIKYPNDKEIKVYMKHLQTIHSDSSMLTLISLLGQYQSGRKSDLFHMNNIKKKASSYFKRILKDVPNVYTQHKPHIFQEVLPTFIQNRVNENDYKTIFNGRASSGRNKPLIIVFYVGGVTYTEAKEADIYEDAKVIVGGSFVHNSKTFIGEVIQLKSLNEQVNE